MIRGALWAGLELGAPLLGVSLLVGVIVSTLQAATQINEMTLTFIPKIVAVGAVLWVFGGWMLDSWLSYILELWSNLGSVGLGP